MGYDLLERINAPEDLKKLNKNQMPALANEIRDFLVERTSKNGGHLASNLGAVELTLAIHRVFDSPRDHIIFDVGHQAYVHKLLTGRREAFDTLRVPGGLSGFTLRRESEHDPFGAGHSSTSISAALGFAESDRLNGKKVSTVCVIGDGAYTGGMVHEALNNCRSDLPLVIILNENGMSISLNRGTFASYLARVRVSGKYRRLKKGTQNVVLRLPLIGKPLKRFITAIKSGIKRFVFSENYFEELGLYYIGPVDGNDYEKTEKAIALAKSLGKTVVVHLKTQKGKGYDPAEISPDGYHSVTAKKNDRTYHEVFADELIKIAEENERVVAVTAAMGIGTGLDAFGAKIPDRYFDVGIAEEHALTFSAGLAANGMIPFIAIYSTFLQRGYDSILHDIALQSLPVKIMIDRAGLSLGDGATHHGIFDVAFLSHIPNVTLLAPIGYDSLSRMIKTAVNTVAPVAIRYPNASQSKVILDKLSYISQDASCSILADFNLEDVPRYVFITYGRIAEKVWEAKDILSSRGINSGIIIIETIKPYDKVAQAIAKIISKSQVVLYVEEGIKNGGAAQITRDHLDALGFDFSKTAFRIAAIDDNFAAPGSVCDLYDFVGLSPQKLARKILEI